MPHKILQSRIFVWQPWALLAPALLTLVALVIVPFVQTLHLAFSHDPHGFVPAQAGATLENFWILRGGSGRGRSVRTTGGWALGAGSVEGGVRGARGLVGGSLEGALRFGAQEEGIGWDERAGSRVTATSAPASAHRSPSSRTA